MFSRTRSADDVRTPTPDLDTQTRANNKSTNRSPKVHTVCFGATVDQMVASLVDAPWVGQISRAWIFAEMGERLNILIMKGDLL